METDRLENRYTQTELLVRAVIGYQREEDGHWVPGLQQQAVENQKEIIAQGKRIDALDRRMDRRAYIDSLFLRYAGGFMLFLIVIIAYKLTFHDVSGFVHP